MKYLGKITEPFDMVNKAYVDKTSAGGSTSVANLFLSNTASTVSGYKTLNYVSDSTATEVAVTCTSSADVLSATYLYTSPIGTTLIDAGVWKSTFQAKCSANAGTNRLKFTCFVRHTDNTETDLFTNYTNSIDQTTYGYFYTETSRQLFTVLATDTLGFRVYGNTSRNSSTTITYYIGGTTPSYFNIPLVLRHSQLRDINGELTYQHITTTSPTNGQIATWNGTTWVNQDAQSFSQQQTNWNETNTSSVQYIQNKPTKLSQFNNDTNFITASASITGNAATATKATQDASGNVITTTYAPLASPALTGTPTAPTATSGTNTTQIATTAFVQQAISGLGSQYTLWVGTSDAYNAIATKDANTLYFLTT